MLILAIETSCDETSLAFIQMPEKEEIEDKDFYEFINSAQVIAQVISSQIKIHQEYGGVVPEIGARNHADQIHFLLKNTALEAAQKLNLNGENPDLEVLGKVEKIAVTTNPGLPSALRVGLTTAKSLKFFIENSNPQKNVEIIEVNHLRGHAISCFYSTNLLYNA
jgi:N6-L-threonylcarbamoyladenine synthase